jgi:hypothetical protein
MHGMRRRGYFGEKWPISSDIPSACTAEALVHGLGRAAMRANDARSSRFISLRRYVFCHNLALEPRRPRRGLVYRSKPPTCAICHPARP